MKKVFATVIALTMLTATLSGCTSNNNNSSGNSGNSNVSDSSNVSDNSGNSDNSNNSNSGNTSDSPSEGTSEIESDLPDPNGRAAKMGAAAMEADEWPAMMDVVDPEFATMFFGIDLSMCEDYYLSNQLISANLNEVVIAKPVAGKEDDLKAVFDAHFEYIKNDAAFYPDQEPSAAGAVNGTTNDGYYYIIVHENGDSIASAMLAAE